MEIDRNIVVFHRLLHIYAISLLGVFIKTVNEELMLIIGRLERSDEISNQEISLYVFVFTRRGRIQGAYDRNENCNKFEDEEICLPWCILIGHLKWKRQVIR